MPNIIKQAIAAIALTATVGAVSAQESGWQSGYQMGTSYAGVSNAQTARLTFYCGDSAAARASPAITSGPYLTASLPKAPGLESVRSLEIVINGRAKAIPVQPRADGGMVELNWKPSPAFDLSQMRPVVTALRMASTIALRAGGQSAMLPSNGAAKALADNPLGCK
jgi:hypothetical protein